MGKKEYLMITLIVVISLVVAVGVVTTFKTILDPGYQKIVKGPDNPSPQYLTYSEWDNGTITQVHPKDIITIRLPENPTTGYQWEITKSDGLRILDDSYISTHPSGRMTGDGGWRRMTLTPDMPGTESLSAVCKRSWEAETGSEMHYSLQFEVQ